jgi:hypothetical protein
LADAKNPGIDRKGEAGAEGASGNTDSLENAFGGTETTPAKPPETKPEGAADPAPKEVGKGSGADGDTGGTDAAWMKQLPEELKGNPDAVKRLAKFGKIGDLAKSYIELENKAAGMTGVPGRDAGAEEIAAFWKKMGKPEAKEGYSIAGQKESAVFLDAAHGANLTDAQATAVYEHLKTIGQAQLEAAKEAASRRLADTEAALRKEYGGKYDEKYAFLKRGLSAVGKEAAQQFLVSGLAGHEGVVKAFITLGETNAESGAPRGGSGGGGKNKGSWYGYGKPAA